MRVLMPSILTSRPGTKFDLLYSDRLPSSRRDHAGRGYCPGASVDGVGRREIFGFVQSDWRSRIVLPHDHLPNFIALGRARRRSTYASSLGRSDGLPQIRCQMNMEPIITSAAVNQLPNR